LRLLNEGICPPEVNMARDAALFEAFERGEIPPTLRLYEWASPAITYGVHQRLPEGLAQAAQQLNIPLFRRPTGGKAVLHGHDLTLALVANLPSAHDSSHRTRLYPRQVYLALVPAFIQAFRQLGIPASMGDAPAPHPTHLHDGGDCFATPALTDIIHAETGVKLMGCALRVSERGFLMQASIPRCARLMCPSKSSLVIPIPRPHPCRVNRLLPHSLNAFAP
jgi:lipoate-protein ligase A